MIRKKTIVTTSSFLLTAALLSQIYSFAQTRFQSQKINYSAFTNLAANISQISEAKVSTETISANSEVTAEIINIVDKEISKKIRNSKYVISISKPKKERLAPLKILAVATAATTSATTDLSAYEINNQELINLYSLSIEQMAFSKFESTNLASTYNIEQVVQPEQSEHKDEVVVAQASTVMEESDEVKLVQPSPEKVAEVAPVEVNEEVYKDEEMVMFDYSEKAEEPKIVKSIDEKLYERPISNTVKAAISREIKKENIRDISSIPAIHSNKKEKAEPTKIDNQEIDLESEENIVYDYSTQTSSAVSSFTAPAQTPVAESKFVLRAKEVNLNTHKMVQAHSFEFVPDYERAERADDQSSGEIVFGYSLNGEMNTQTGVIQSQGMISTRVELNLASLNGIEVPLLNEEGIQLFLQKKGLSIEGNLILLAVDPSIIDTEIDSQFAQRLYFDKNFKNIEDGDGAAYVMYAGVKSGNIMVRYLLSNKESAQKIVYVGEGEMYFEDPDFIGSKRETYTFTTRTLLGQKKKELVIDGSAISFFNTNITAKKKALNAYEIKVPNMVSGMRKYLEFKHLNDSIFVGASKDFDIEIPGNDFIAKVLDMNQVTSLKERCVVQVNLSKEIRELKVNGKNRSGEMFVETSYLDADGNFSRDSERSETAFIVGDMEGQFNVRLDYTDGSTEFLKTFCSEGTYLVEQL